MNETKQELDLNELKKIIFKDLGKVLEDLDLDWDLRSNNVFMRCPIHGGDNPNGLSMSLIYKNWRCWTHSCQEEYGSDILSFVGACRQDPTFSDTLRYICKLYNIKKTKQNKKLEEEDPYEDVSRLVNIFKKDNTSHCDKTDYLKPKTNNRSLYFESRGFSRQTLERFGVKDCLDAKSTMSNRAIIPVYKDGREIGYIARATKDFIHPKYLFSDGFKKSEHLYNYDKAIAKAKEKSTMFLVEGQGDVWRMHEAGVTNCVGLFGKDISETQKNTLIKSGLTNIIVLTDYDQAGREGRIKIQRSLHRIFKLIFPWMSKTDIGEMTIDQIEETILTQVRGLY